jgi:predicted SAM-dependent methyltransferase
MSQTSGPSGEKAPGVRVGTGGEPLRLHIGGEEVRAGWKILNAVPMAGVDFVGNCADLSQFGDGSVAEIYASHVYEHLDYTTEFPKALKEAHRVLRAGGILRIGMPDMEALARVIADPRQSPANKFTAMRMLMGGQTNPLDYHKIAVNYGMLEAYLQNAGFRYVRRVESFGLFKDGTCTGIDSIPISLNVQATK